MNFYFGSWNFPRQLKLLWGCCMSFHITAKLVYLNASFLVLVVACNDTNTIPCENEPTGCWVPLPSDGAPAARSEHTAVWADGRMIVWGGMPADPVEGPFHTGAIYISENGLWE